MKYIESLASYVPGLIIDQLFKEKSENEKKEEVDEKGAVKEELTRLVPWRQEYETVCVFCDVSGFTALSEAMQLTGKGAEGLAKHLNSYFSQMVRLIASEGGDVFKFAGDAMIVIWPESEDCIEVTARRAAQCAFAIQKNLHQSEMEAGVSLSVKIGIGVGKVSVLHVGGTFNRVEYLAVGDPLIQAFAAEGHSVAGQVICSKEVWKIIDQFFTAEHIYDDKYVRFDLNAQNKLVPKSSKMRILKHNFPDSDPILERKVKSYVAGAVLPNLNRDCPEDEQWGNEIRRCTVMFVNLGLKESHMLAAAEYDEAMIQVHEVLVTAQQCIYQYEGSINKFLLDDKGSTLIACYGLPPLAHEDDPTRAVLAALLLCEKLFDLGLSASVGITTGDVFCGVVGSKTRREYTVLGDSVNLSARLMQKSNSLGGGVLCDQNSKAATKGTLHFHPLGEIKVKGKSVPVSVFQPYPPHAVLPVTNARSTNPFTVVHMKQLQNAIVRRTFSSLECYFSSENVISNSVKTREVPNGSQKRGKHRRRSMEPSFGTVEDMGAPHTAGLIGHVRSGGPGFRTRKSIVRPSCDVTHATDVSSTENPMASHESRPLSLSGKRRGSVLSNYQLPNSSIPSSRNTVHVVVPTNLATDTLESNNLSPIDLSAVTNVEALRAMVYDMSINAGHINSSTPLDDVRLNISGTRFFLPTSPHDAKWLPDFVRAAKSGFHDDWKEGDPIELILLSKSSMESTQSRLALAHCNVLENKIALLESSRGSVTLLEGEVGVGKTHFLMKLISSSLFNTCPVYFSPASPYSSDALGPFSVIVRQHLDLTSSRRGEGHDRTSILCEMLRSHEELYLSSPLLDAALGTNMLGKIERLLPSDGDLSGSYKSSLHTMSNEEMAAKRFQLYLFLILKIGCERPTAIFVDDAHNLDDDSWAFLLFLSLLMSHDEREARKVLGDVDIPSFHKDLRPMLMVLVSFRPLITHRSIFKGPSTPYNSLVECSNVSFLKLDGISPEEVEELLVDTLDGNVTSVSEELYKVIELKCMANPWMIKQLLESLQCSEPPLLCYQREEPLDGEASRSDSVSTQQSSATGVNTLEPVHVELISDFTMDQCPLPLLVSKSFGTMFDRLNSCQRMILKTACHLGKQFTWSALFSAYPLDGHRHRLQKEMDDLLSIGLVMEIPSPSPTRKDRTYHFISDFLMDFIVVLMLKDQKEKISNYVIKYHTDLESEQRKKFIKQMMTVGGSDGLLKMGNLEVQKEVSTSFWKTKVKRRVEGDWKTRYCVLNYKGLSMYRDEHHFKTSPHSATQVIYLRGATAHVEPRSLYGDRSFVFRVDASSYLKEKQMLIERRSFIMNATSGEDLKSWIYMLKYAVEATEEKETDVDAVKAKATGETQDSVDKVPKNSNDSLSDATVTVTVVGTDDLTTTEVFGANNCYICCSIDSEQKFTAVSFSNFHKYEWNEEFVFSIRRDQWAQSTLAFSARKKDILMTDDILGSSELSIYDVSLDKLYEETVWLPLVKKVKGGVVEVGKLCVEIQLELSDDLIKWIRKSSKRQVKDEILQSSCSNSRVERVHVPGRINTVEDMQHFLSLVKPHVPVHFSHTGSLRTRLLQQLEDMSLEIASMPARRASKVAEGSREVLSHLDDLLRQLRTSSMSEEMIPTAQSGSVNKMWISHELREIISQARRSAPRDEDETTTVLNPFEGVMEQANELDQHEQAWLTNYSNQSNSSQENRAVDVEKETSLHKHMRRASVAVGRGMVKRKSNELQIRRTMAVKMHMAGGHHDQSSSVLEPDIFDPNVNENEGYYVLDASDQVNGPYSARQLFDWLNADYIHPQVFVRHGPGSASDHFFPLAIYARPLHRIVCQSIDVWPEINSHSGVTDINNYCSWDFNIWELEPYELLPLSMLIMSSLGLAESFNIDAAKWKNFMSRVSTLMTCHHNPYHNFYHISDVAQTCFVLLTHFEACHLFMSIEILSLMVSAIVHDLDHPGFNNAYQVNKGTALAIRYNDASVLENHHCALAFEVLNTPECGIFDALDSSTRRSVRKLMISIILATDMSFHFNLQSEVTKLSSRECFRGPDASSDQTSRSLSMQLNDSDRETLLKVVLHVSDISNSAKVWSVCKKWSDLVCQEFFEQGECEKREGLPVTPSMDKDTTFQDELSLNFTDFIIAPYFFALTAVLPKLSEVVKIIETNRAVWHSMLMKRLQSSDAGRSGDMTVEEAVLKWEKREKLFLEAVNPVKKSAAEKQASKRSTS